MWFPRKASEAACVSGGRSPNSLKSTERLTLTPRGIRQRSKPNLGDFKRRVHDRDRQTLARFSRQ